VSKSPDSILSRTVAAARRLKLSKAEIAELSCFANTYQRWLHQLRASAAAGDTHKARHIAGQVTMKFPAKVCALIHEIDPEQAELWSLSLIKAMASEVHLNCSIPESVRLRFEVKSNGGYRPVISFGLKRRTAQRVCSDLLKCLFPLQDFDFLARGRGQELAVLRLKQFIEKENSQYIVIVDIKDCFGSPNKEKLRTLLRLPSWVVNHSLLIGNEVAISPHPSVKEIPSISIAEHVKENGAARRGIPQGSSASPVVMYRAVLGPLLATLSFSSRVFSFGDDIAVPAKDLKTAEAYLKTLTSVLLTSPVGPLAIGRHKITTLAQGADYLGYRISRKPQFYGGYIHLRPSPRSFARLEQGAMARFLNAGKGDTGAQEVQTYVGHWMSAFGLWVPNQTSKELIGLSLAAVGIPTPSPSIPVQSS
jgi:hypothetical protein